MRAAIHNPYLDSLGGGERYTITFAEVLVKNGWSVDVEWGDEKIRKKLEKRFGTSYENINFVRDVKRGDGYDLCFWVSDGSVPTLRARKNFLHFQVPFHNVGGNSLLNKMKLFRINEIICNSKFTKKIVDDEYGVESVVVYPPVSVNRFKSRRKENIILSIGRFSQLKQSKHQDILIRAFKKLVDEGTSDWKLVLAGGVEVGVSDYIDKMRKLATGYPVEIIESPDFKSLLDLYGSSKIFWSASGYGEDDSKNPEKVEHFGISIIEAMASGAVPFAYDAGGHRETIRDEINGFFWTSILELVRKTKKTIETPKILREIAVAGKIDSEKYSEERFARQIISLL